jgi:hypothetical protein
MFPALTRHIPDPDISMERFLSGKGVKNTGQQFKMFI